MPYIQYINSNALRLAELAEELGEYKLASNTYSRVLYRLRQYQGDRMYPIQLGATLASKIEELSPMSRDKGLGILRRETWNLTKTSFVKGNQCIKQLHLDKYKRKLQSPVSAETLALFKKGHQFEDLVRETEFPGGINIKDKVGDFQYFNSYTRYVLQTKETATLYEATLIEDGVLVMFDILTKDKNGRYNIYEIKLNTTYNDTITQDMAIQYLIAKKRFGDNLNTFNVILRKEQEDETTPPDWIITNKSHELEYYLESTREKMNLFRQVLNDSEPDVPMGEHCHNPYDCRFIEYCKGLQ